MTVVWIAQTEIPGLFDVWKFREGELHVGAPDRMPDFWDVTLGQINGLAHLESWVAPSGAPIAQGPAPMLVV